MKTTPKLPNVKDGEDVFYIVNFVRYIVRKEKRLV